MKITAVLPLEVIIIVVKLLASKKITRMVRLQKGYGYSIYSPAGRAEGCFLKNGVVLVIYKKRPKGRCGGKTIETDLASQGGEDSQKRQNEEVNTSTED